MTSGDEAESSQESEETDPDSLAAWPAAFVLTFEVVIILSMLPVLLFEVKNRELNQAREAKRTKYWMTAVFVSNIVVEIFYMMYNCACFGFDCNVMHAMVYSSKYIVKGINLLYLIHRAKLVQGMSSILSKVWFEKVLPIMVLLFIFGNVIGGMRDWLTMNLTCTAYHDTDSVGVCTGGVTATHHRHVVRVRILLLLDVIIVTSLMILFVVPLYRIHKVNLGRMNANQLRQRAQLQRLLVWSVFLTFINQVSTTAGLLWFVFDLTSYPLIRALLILILKLDPSINVWSSWLMINRNRQYVQQVFSCTGSNSTREQTNENELESNLQKEDFSSVVLQSS